MTLKLQGRCRASSTILKSHIRVCIGVSQSASWLPSLLINIYVHKSRH